MNESGVRPMGWRRLLLLPLALLASLGVVLLALYLSFYPTAILLRRKKIELSWWVPPGDQPSA